jgi:hypothetical protein
MKQTLESLADTFGRLDGEATRQVMGAAAATNAPVKFTLVGTEVGPGGELWPSYREDPE